MSAGAAPPVPRATYRLQLNKDFRFDAAAALAPYLNQLGISHAYLSPILMARAGSTHGYDTVDHRRINPELGGLDDFRRMAAAFRAQGIGLIVDFVPNHMGVGGADNPYWLDVLEHGESSRYAGWFDIDWKPADPTLQGKLLVPFLDRPYGVALVDGTLALRFDTASKTFAVWAYGHHKLPLDPSTYPEIAAVDRINGRDGDPGSKRELAALIDVQHWRISPGIVADDAINYRRFFIVNDLAGIRIERPEVFEQAHALIFSLIAEGLIDGLRIDHIDGLLDPAAYCLELRRRAPRPIYIVVEKILAADEALPDAWQIEGTTGYEFASLATPLLVDPAGESGLTAHYAGFAGRQPAPADIEHDCKLRVMDRELAAELDALSYRLAGLARQDLMARDLTRLALKRGLRAVVAALPVYRVYVDADGASATDRRTIDLAIAAARRRDADLDPALLAFLREVLTGDFAPSDPIAGHETAIDIAKRVQQFTGPVMAKGLEDTALYRYNRLIALNDVGERPEPFSLPVAAFHAANAERARHHPHSMLGTSTHDSKRGEDARARIAAISGHVPEWISAAGKWRGLLAERGAPAIDPNDAYHVFQLLLGAWPTEPSGTDFADRLVATMQKSLREARVHTGWTRPNLAYEQQVEDFIRRALDPAPDNAFLTAFGSFEQLLGRDGALNGLIETTLKLTLPGVPDIYQGAELWEQSMVDPDNRRPVDFARRTELLQANLAANPTALMRHWRDGAIKQWLIARLLSFRRDHAPLFDSGSYEPVDIGGPDADRCCAFLRHHGGEALFVAVALYPGRGDAPRLPTLPALGVGWTNVLTGEAASAPEFTAPLPLAVFAR